MKFKVWFEESGTIDSNVFPFLSDRTRVVFEGGRSTGKTHWITVNMQDYEKQKEQKTKFPQAKSKFHKSKKRS